MKKISLIVIYILHFFTLKSQNPNFEWVKKIGGVSDDSGNSIVVDTSGNVYTTGSFQGTVDFDPSIGIFNLTSLGNYDTYILKSDSLGNFIWAKNIGGSGSNSEGLSIALDFFGNVVLTGTYKGTVDFDPSFGNFNMTSSGLNDIFILKLNALGNFVWANSMGGASYDVGNSLAIDAVGNIVTTGYFGGVVDFDPGAGIFNLSSSGPSDIFISKLDANGNFLWTKQIGGTSGDRGESLVCDTLNNIYLAGEFRDTVDFDPGVTTYTIGAIGNDIFVLKLNSAGNFVWAKQMKGSSNMLGGINNVYSITTDKASNVYTTGMFRDTVDFDPSISTYSLISNGPFDAFVSKLDVNGNFIWAKQIGGIGNDDAGSSIKVDILGNVYTTGIFELTVDFDPGIGTFNLTSYGLEDVFILKLDSLGNFIWAKQIGGNDADQGNSIFVDKLFNIYTTGFFSTTADFDPSSNTFNLTSLGLKDAFIHKMSQSIVTDIKKYENNNNILIYPNPTNNLLTISSTNNFYNIVLLNLTGQILVSESVHSKSHSLQLQNFSEGIYFVKIFYDNGINVTKKVVKQ